MLGINPCLWFDSQAEEAARFYVSVFPNSRIGTVQRYGEAGPGDAGSVLMVTFELDGRVFQAINGGPAHANSFSEAISFATICADQSEVDLLWGKLTANGGEEGQCGWLKDRYGVSWQIVPRALIDLMADPDPAKAASVTQAMLKMQKIDVQTLREAHAAA